MPPEEHDLLIAAASHLPHAVASALVLVAAESKISDREALDFAAKGFEDTTRVAASDPELWTAILMQNADIVSLLLSKLEDELAEMRELLRGMDEDKLMEKLEKAKKIKDLLR
jgi:prephenate dehydrogenase